MRLDSYQIKSNTLPVRRQLGLALDLFHHRIGVRLAHAGQRPQHAAGAGAVGVPIDTLGMVRSSSTSTNTSVPGTQLLECCAGLHSPGCTSHASGAARGPFRWAMPITAEPQATGHGPVVVGRVSHCFGIGT